MYNNFPGDLCMKNIFNIVVTGGPCGGKTTALDELSKLLRSYGYTVYVVSEVATELISDGIRPFGDNKLSVYDFQSLIVDSQIAKEKIRREAALKCPNDNVAILYDRGVHDNKAYLSNPDFLEVISKRGYSEPELLSRYDLVIHMMTAAIGKEEYYTLENNNARTETVEEARASDKKTMEAWKDHPNLKIVSNDTLFNEKVERVKNIIRGYLGEEEVIKRERYLVEDIDLEYFKYNAVQETIDEFVDQYDDEVDRMYSKSTIIGSSYYTCSKNRYNPDGSKVTTCKTISASEYFDKLSSISGNVIKKYRYNFIDDNERFRLDVYDINGKNITILERDVTNINKKELPSFIKKCTDITNDRNYNDDSIYVDYNIENIYKVKRKK